MVPDKVMYDLRVIVAVVVIHQLDIRTMHCSKLFRIFYCKCFDGTVITFVMKVQ